MPIPGNLGGLDGPSPPFAVAPAPGIPKLGPAGVVAFAHPQADPEPSTEYHEFVSIAARGRILDVVRNETPQRNRIIIDIVDSLLEYDDRFPSGFAGAALAVLSLGIKVRARRKRRELYGRIVRSILEQVFDPWLEYTLTKKDILDAFEANGFPRTEVSTAQVGQIYVKILDRLQVGDLRDLTHEEDLQRYVRVKIREIRFSRQDWELNGR